MKNFSCNGCTGCCHGAISLTLEESVGSHRYDFPLAVIYSVSDVRNLDTEKSRSSYSRAMRRFNKDVSAFYHKTSDNRKILVVPQIISLIPYDEPCLNLNEDGLCDIYSKRPSVCRLYPVRIDTPITHIEEGLAKERNQSYEGSAFIPCEGWGSQEVFYTSRGPVDVETVPLLRSRAQAQSKTRDVLKSFFLELVKSNEISSKVDQYSALNTNDFRMIQVSFHSLASWMEDKGMISSILGEFIKSEQYEMLSDVLNHLSERSDPSIESFKTVLVDHMNLLKNPK